ncbi:hypothetical protein ABIF65_005439 [Bradyrhizobium japonicum]|nr:hypothetical protein [Bradyrhizobium japonicum]MCP1861488.1 hypothetical protein [Bradyrhizobium japonicum]MCP1892248.1 hypothetical protein [Bradyrhizobium japonicum]MCP1965651.1 hypothetical protein [Bradyrhizobium japonicum]MCW2325370.1 hypothetical protein [Bradyrhizobium japonicum]
MAVEMIGGPRLCEPLLATGLGRFTSAASRHANGPRKRTSPHWTSGWRRIATRYDKLARNYFSALCLVPAVAFWL